MQVPVEIDCQNLPVTPAVRNTVDKHVAELERYGRLTGCRVVVKGPGGHHATGGIYEVHVHLTLPGQREVNVSRTTQSDERHEDLNFAIASAFKRARRQLEDVMSRMRGNVKRHEVPGSP